MAFPHVRSFFLSLTFLSLFSQPGCSSDSDERGSSDSSASGGQDDGSGGTDDPATGGEGSDMTDSGGTGGGNETTCEASLSANSSEAALAMDVSAAGVSVLVGTDLPSGGNENIEIIGLDPEGTRLFRVEVNGNANLSDRGRAAAIHDENVFAGGSMGDFGGWLGAYDLEGNELWTRLADPTSVLALVATEDAVYGAGSNDLFAYNHQGDELWRVTLDSEIQPNDLRANGDRVVLAAHRSPDGMPFTGWVEAFDPSDGSSLWDFTVPTDGESRAEGVALGADGTSWAVGYESTDDGRAAWVRQLDSNGMEVTHFNHAAGGADDRGLGIAVDSESNIVFGGRGPTSSSGWVRKVNPMGDEIWTMAVEAVGREDTVVDHVRVDEDNFIYVVGSDSPWKKFCP